MEISQIELTQGLTFLVWVTGIVILVVGGFLTKLIIDISKLTKNVNETTEILNKELKPTLESLSETLKTVNELVKTTDKGFGNIKDGIEKFLGKTRTVSETIFGGVIKGFLTMLGIFSKK